MNKTKLQATIVGIIFIVGGISFASSSGLYVVWNSNGWYTHEVPPTLTAGIEFNALCRDSVQDSRFYAARADGGIETYNYGGIWAKDLASPTVDMYNDIAAWPTYNRRYVAANAGGGLDVIALQGYYWNLLETIPGTAGITYVALDTDKVNYSIRELFAAKAGGGVDQILLSGSWLIINLGHTSGTEYVALTADINEARKYYGAKVGGGIDLVLETSSSELAGTAGKVYVSLATDRTVDDRMYGVTATGGIDVIYLEGGTWIIEPIPTGNTFYTTIDTYQDPSKMIAASRGARCGDAGTLIIGDLNQDCYVDFDDFAELGNQWMKCSNPEDPNCE